MPPVTRETSWRASNKVLTQVAQTSAASVRMRSIAQPKADTTPKLLFPTEGTVATLQPTFRWRADPALKGDFTLYIIGQEKPVHTGKGMAGTYKLPAKLKPETEYSWTLASGGNELGSGRFRTLSGDAVAQLEKRRPGEKAEFSDRIMSCPSRSTRPTASGITKGCFAPWPAVGGQDCFTRSVKVFLRASYSPRHSTTGVPACEYQRANWSRFTPFASAMAARKSSHVTAWPSWRLK